MRVEAALRRLAGTTGRREAGPQGCGKGVRRPRRRRAAAAARASWTCCPPRILTAEAPKLLPPTTAGGGSTAQLTGGGAGGGGGAGAGGRAAHAQGGKCGARERGGERPKQRRCLGVQTRGLWGFRFFGVGAKPLFFSRRPAMASPTDGPAHSARGSSSSSAGEGGGVAFEVGCSRNSSTPPQALSTPPLPTRGLHQPETEASPPLLPSRPGLTPAQMPGARAAPRRAG